SAAGSSPLSIARPSSAQVGDTAVLHFGCTSSDVEPTVPAGFTLVESETAVPSICIYTKIIEPLEPDTYTVTFASGSTRRLGLLVLRASAGNSPTVDVSDTQVNASGNRVFPSVTTTVADTLLAMFATNGSTGAITPPAGATEQY